MSIEFASVPRVGTVLSIDGQTYRLIKAEPYTRKDGDPSWLLKWRAPCAECGDDFEVVTGLRGKNPNRRCGLHRAPLTRVVKGRRRSDQVKIADNGASA
jgi:hypothetical protein